MTEATLCYAADKLYGRVPDVPIPDGYRDRLEALFGGRRDLIVALSVLALVVAVVLGLRLHTPAPKIAPPADGAPVADASPRAGSRADRIFVHVAGAVRAPGLYALKDGERVADAVAAAGGPRAKADLDAINLAEVLVDGAKIDIPERGDPAVPAPPTDPASSTPAPSVIDVNSADVTTLETIPGIGPVLAAAIVQHRDENGPFPSVDALIDVSGIGPATLESVRPYVRV